MKNQKIYNAKEFKNIKEIIYNSVKLYGEKIAYVIKHKDKKDVSYENVTYKRLLDDANKLGTALFDMGFQKKRIAIIGKNRYEWALAHVTNMLGGCVSVPLDKDLQFEEFETSLIRSKAECIIFDEKHLDMLNKVIENRKTKLKEFILREE